MFAERCNECAIRRRLDEYGRNCKVVGFRRSGITLAKSFHHIGRCHPDSHHGWEFPKRPILTHQGVFWISDRSEVTIENLAPCLCNPARIVSLLIFAFDRLVALALVRDIDHTQSMLARLDDLQQSMAALIDGLAVSAKRYVGRANTPSQDNMEVSYSRKTSCSLDSHPTFRGSLGAPIR